VLTPPALLLHFLKQVLRRSQLIFIYIFLLGAIFMNLTVLAFYGPNDNSACMNRVWLFNLSSTIMYAPLIMKLHRVEMFYRQVQRGQRRKNISDTYVLMQVRGEVRLACTTLVPQLCVVPSGVWDPVRGHFDMPAVEHHRQTTATNGASVVRQRVRARGQHHLQHVASAAV